MDAWTSVGGDIGRGLAEIGQEWIFNRLHEAVSSGLTLDVADCKESMDHKLIHLVWRKVPRNADNSTGMVDGNAEQLVRKPEEIPPEEGKKKKRQRNKQQQVQEIPLTPCDNISVTPDSSESSVDLFPSAFSGKNSRPLIFVNSGRRKKRSDEFALDTNRFTPPQGENSTVKTSPACLSLMSDCLDAEEAGECGTVRAESSATVSNHQDSSEQQQPQQEEHNKLFKSSEPDIIYEAADLDHSSAVCVPSPSLSVNNRSWNEVRGKRKNKRKIYDFGTREEFFVDTSNRFIPLQACSSVPTLPAESSLNSDCLAAEEAGADGTAGAESSTESIGANKYDQTTVEEFIKKLTDKMAANFEEILLGKPP